MACARVLVNLGLVFHSCNQMCTSRDPDEYPTLHHLRNANKQRVATKDSFKILSNILLEMASQPEANQSPVELVNFCPSPSAPVSRRSSRNSATPQHCLPCPRACTGKTPGKGSSVDNPHPEFVERCAACNGIFPSVKYDPMKRDQRMKCSVCKRKTSNFC